MITAPIRGAADRLLQAWRARLVELNEERVIPATAQGGGFSWQVLIFFLIAVAFVAVQMWQFAIPQLRPPILPEALYFGSLIAAVYPWTSQKLSAIIGYSLLAIALCSALDMITHADWGSIGLYAVIAIISYRLPLRLSVPVVAVCTFVILMSQGIGNWLSARAAVNAGAIVTDLLIVGFAFVASLARRSRYLLIDRLEQTQQQLREEMGRTAELAAARERARIARDVHDVLAHSLTVLSVQVQALRQLVRDNPERAAAMLDQMAEVLRESQEESRQIVGLLREAMTEEMREGGADIVARLRVTAERFTERTGMRCTLHEHGSTVQLSTQHVEALHFALQEALTNAYRHGRASYAEAELWWEKTTVRLTVRDDGTSPPLQSEGSGNGLRGMRERASALGGVVEAAPRTDGGFEVSITLPVGVERARKPEREVTFEARKAGESIA
jgi:signal transduction histidine kinase